MVDHAYIVAGVKADLEHRGVALSGPCGAFEITKRVAWALRGEGAGLLDKPSGNNCAGYAVDIIAYPDGVIVDCLSDAGGSNGPSWNPAAVDLSMVARYRQPIDPGDAAAPPPPASSAATADDVLSRLIDMEVRLERLRLQSDANTDKIQQQIDQAVKSAETTGQALIPILQTAIPTIADLFRRR